MAKVILKQVSKRYAGHSYAVRDCNLEIHDKEFMVFVGPSGCGKSTTLRMIAGLETISDGEVYIGDRLVNHVPPKDRDIAMVFQSYALYPHMTVYENLAFGLKLRKFSKEEIHARVTNAAKILGISHLIERKPKALSGGERQRVAVGRAIVRKPHVFLFDEPLSNLDAKMRVQMRTEISKLHKRLQTTMIYVTHDQVEAMTMGDRIVVMKDGIVQQVDTPLNIYEGPANKFVAGFIGVPPMNLIEGELKRVNGDLLFVHGHSIQLPLIPDMAQKLMSRAGQPIVMGIRSEDIYDKLFAKTSTESNTVNSIVEVVEQMGSEIFVYLTVEDCNLIARVDAHQQLEPNQDIDLVFDMSRCHFFDPETEINLLYPLKT